MRRKNWAKSKFQLLRGRPGDGWRAAPDWGGASDRSWLMDGVSPSMVLSSRHSLSPGDWPRRHAGPYMLG